MSSNAPLLFEATNDDLFSFTQGDCHGVLYPSKDEIGLGDWVWKISRTVIRRSRNDAGELTDVRVETLSVSEGYAQTAEEAARDMRTCLGRQVKV